MKSIRLALGLLSVATGGYARGAGWVNDAPASSSLARVEVLARSFETGKPLAGARIHWLEQGRVVRTDRAGRASLVVPVGQELTLAMRRSAYRTLQTATVKVPPGGLVGPGQELTFQAARKITYRLLCAALGPQKKPGRHHVVTTVTAAGKRLGITPHGEPGATVELVAIDGARAPDHDRPIYFDTVPITGRTDPLRTFLRRLGLLRPLTRTTPDGGVAFPNVRPGRYEIVAHKDGVTFSRTTIAIRPDSPRLINASPPHGPMALPSM